MRRLTLAIVIVLTGCRQQTSTGSLRIDSTLASLVPDDTLFLMGADIEAIRNTSVYQKHIGIVELPRLNEFTRQTGMDPRKDLDDVLSMSNGKNGVFMAQGKFNVHDVEARLAQQNTQRFDYKGFKFFGDDRSSITFFNTRTALAGTTATLKSIIDNHNNGRRGLPAQLADRLRSLPAASQIWAVFIGGVQGLDVTVPPNSNLGAVVRLLRGLESAVIGMDLRNGFDLRGDAMCRSEENAKQIRVALKGVIGLGRLSTPDNQPDLLKVYDAIQVQQNQSKVELTAHVPPELADKFVDLWLKGK